LTFRWAILHMMGGWAGGAISVLLGLAALASACYASNAYGRNFAAIWPRVSQALAVWTGGIAAFALVVVACSRWTGVIFSAMGDFFAPVIGAMLGDRLGQRGGWSDRRVAWNPTGVAAWATGSLVAVLLELVVLLRPQLAGWMPPTSLLGLLVSGLSYRLLAAGRLELQAEVAAKTTANVADPGAAAR
jgi:purine-cytosine permease-like protein